MQAKFAKLFLTGVISVIYASSSIATSQDHCFTDATVHVEEARHALDKNNQEQIDRWYKQAVEANHAAVIHMIARANVEHKDYEKAYRLYERGARLGDYQSMYDLGVMWMKGEGRDADLSKAYGWFLLTGEYIPTNWDDYFFPPSMIRWHKALADNLKRKMTADQVEAGGRYYEEQKKQINCDWYSWYGAYITSEKKLR